MAVAGWVNWAVVRPLGGGPGGGGVFGEGGGEAAVGPELIVGTGVEAVPHAWAVGLEVVHGAPSVVDLVGE